MRPEELRSALTDLNALMVSDLVALWRSVEGRDVEFLREALQAELPGVVDPYLSASGDITADWYEAQAPELGYVARPAALRDEGQLRTTARWAAGTVLTPSDVTPLDLLSGSMQRALFDESRITIIENAGAEPGALWARHASANACEFCRMVATRGAVYASETAASRVGSTRVRGNQSSGDRYHDNCRCIAVPVRPGRTYEPPPYMEEWESEYARARRAADGNDAKSIMSAWRKLQPE